MEFAIDDLKDPLSDLTTELRCVGDADGNLMRQSGPWEAVLGECIRESVVDLLELVHPEDYAQTYDAFFGPAAYRRPVVVRSRMRHCDGTWRWLEWHAWRPDEEHILGVARDISEEVRLVELLRRNEELLCESQREAGLGHYVFDIPADRWEPSEALAEVFGIDAATYRCDFAGWLQVVHPLDREMMAEYVTQEVLGKGKPFDMNYRIQRVNDGAERWVHGRGRLTFDESGAPISLFGVIQDITDSIRSAQEVEREHSLLARAEEIAHAGSWRLDLRTGVVTWSEGMHETFCVSHEAFTGLVDSLFDAVHADDVDELRRMTSQAIATARPQPTEYRIVRSDGETRWIHGEAAPEMDADGNVVALVGFAQDVTELRRSQRDLIDSNERLEDMVYEVAEAMGKIVEIRDPYTQGHQDGVARIAEAIAREMGLPEDQIAGVKMGSVVHDIGKLGVPAEILTKPGALSKNEFELIKMHPARGYEILSEIAFPWSVAEIALQHHERLDGTGYPQGLKGDDILLEARIVAVADVIEAMASHRPYRAALGLDVALQEIRAFTPQKYDPDVTAACMRLYEAGQLEV